MNYQATHTGTYLARLIIEIGKLINIALPLLGGIALLIFFWGLAKFIFYPDKKEEGRNRMVQGVIALFVMVSVWGLVALLRVFVGLDAYDPGDPGFRDPTQQEHCYYDQVLKREFCIKL